MSLVSPDSCLANRPADTERRRPSDLPLPDLHTAGWPPNQQRTDRKETVRANIRFYETNICLLRRSCGLVVSVPASWPPVPRVRISVRGLPTVWSEGRQITLYR